MDREQYIQWYVTLWGHCLDSTIMDVSWYYDNIILYCGFNTNSHFVRVSNKSDNIAPYTGMRKKSLKHITHSFFPPSYKKP